MGGNKPEHEHHIGSKFFDYIGARTPILVVGDPTYDAGNIVDDYDLGKSVSDEDPEVVANAIEQLLDDKPKFNPKSSVYDMFSREERLERLLDILNIVIETG